MVDYTDYPELIHATKNTKYVENPYFEEGFHPARSPDLIPKPLDQQQALRLFAELIRNITDTDYGDFMRKANSYLNELKVWLKGSSSILKKIDEMQEYTQFAPNWNVELTRRRLLSDVTDIMRQPLETSQSRKTIAPILMDNLAHRFDKMSQAQLENIADPIKESDRQLIRNLPIRNRMNFLARVKNLFWRKQKMKTDSEIQADVMKELKWDPSITSEHIGVAVSNRVVTLTGRVPSYTEKWAAEKAVQRVADVKAIADELEVKLPSSSERDDVAIAKAAADALKWHVSVPDNVKAVVDGGWITLTGDVEWNFEKEATESAVRNLFGVRGVINNVTVKPRIKMTEVKEKIKEALERTAIEEAEKIKVEVTGNKVILKGKVHSWDEYWAAKNAAWSAPGVVEVETTNLDIAS